MSTTVNTIILGSGGHARVLMDIVKSSTTWAILGYTDVALGELGDVPYLGNDFVLETYLDKGILLINGIGSIESPRKRREIYKRLSQAGYRFANITQTNAAVSKRTSIREGVQIIGASVIQTGTEIGENCIINTSAIIDHDCTIGAHTHIAPGVVLSGGVRIGEECHIGTGSVVIQGITIGDGALIGAGSLVISDIPSGVKAYGSPAKIIGPV